MTTKLFLYGVLQPDLARGEVAELVADLRGGEPAVVTGQLYAVGTPKGWYPAFLPDPSGGFVHGQLFDAEALDFGAMDAFEGDEYVRRPIAVRPRGGHWTSAEAYCWNATTKGLERIADGNFAEWLSATRRQAFSA